MVNETNETIENNDVEIDVNEYNTGIIAFLKSPRGRKYIYRIVAAILAIVVAISSGNAISSESWLELAAAILGLSGVGALELAVNNIDYGDDNGGNN